MNIFAVDGPLMNFLNKVADLIIVNVLWLICSLPILTIGASTTAMQTVVLQIVRNEEAHVSKTFFEAFRKNFKQSTIAWLIILGIGSILYLDFYFCTQLSGGGRQVFLVAFVVLTFLLLITVNYLFPIQAFFENSTRKLFKNSFFMAIAHVPATMVIFLMNLLPWLLLFFGEIFMAVFINVIIGFSFVAWVNARIFRKMFDKYEAEFVQE